MCFLSTVNAKAMGDLMNSYAFLESHLHISCDQAVAIVFALVSQASGGTCWASRRALNSAKTCVTTASPHPAYLPYFFEAAEYVSVFFKIFNIRAADQTQICNIFCRRSLYQPLYNYFTRYLVCTTGGSVRRQEKHVQSTFLLINQIPFDIVRTAIAVFVLPCPGYYNIQSKIPTASK